MDAILMTLFVGLYFLPSILGWNKNNSGAIMVLNILLGWTVIGWIVALVWAISNDSPPPVQIVQVEKKKKKKKKTKEEGNEDDNSNNKGNYIR